MKRSIAFLLCVVVLILTPYNCFAESSQDRPDANHALSDAEGAPITLQDYLYCAALNNAGLKAAFEQWKAAVEQVPQAKTLPDPKFTYGYFIREVETRVGPQRQRFGIMQQFPWLGKIEAQTDAAAAAARAARKRYDAKKLKLFYETSNAFYEYTYLARAVEIATENLELIRHFEEVARTKYVAAAATHPDVIRAQVELAKLQDHLKTLEELRKPIVAHLNAILNRRSFEMLPWPQRGELRTAQMDRQQLIEILRRQNPELQALVFEIEAAGHKITLAQKKFWPDVGVGLDWIQTDGAIMSGTKGSGKDPVILMFTLNLPVWRDSYKSAELQAMAEMSRTLQQKTEIENNIIAQVERALYDFEDSGRKIKLYGDVLVPKAEELLGASETAYKAGTIDFLSLINAQQKLLEFQLQYERAVTNNQQGLAELEMLAGTELPKTIKLGQ